MALSIGFRVLVSLHPAIQATGRLALAPTGLAPTRRTCLLWTRNHQIRPQQQRRRDGEAEGLRGLEVEPTGDPSRGSPTGRFAKRRPRPIAKSPRAYSGERTA